MTFEQAKKAAERGIALRKYYTSFLAIGLIDKGMPKFESPEMFDDWMFSEEGSHKANDAILNKCK